MVLLLRSSDIWNKNKLEKGINKMKNLNKNKPILYGRTVTNENCDKIIGKYLVKENSLFRNSLLQCYAGEIQ